MYPFYGRVCRSTMQQYLPRIPRPLLFISLSIRRPLLPTFQSHYCLLPSHSPLTPCSYSTPHSLPYLSPYTLLSQLPTSTESAPIL